MKEFLRLLSVKHLYLYLKFKIGKLLLGVIVGLALRRT